MSKMRGESIRGGGRSRERGFMRKEERGERKKEAKLRERKQFNDECNSPHVIDKTRKLTCLLVVLKGDVVKAKYSGSQINDCK